MQLNEYIAAYLPNAYRGLKDYESGAGWVNLMNRLLKNLEVNGLFNTTKIKERGTEVDNDYWITKPADLRKLIKVYNPFSTDTIYPFRYLNGKYKLDIKSTKNSDPDTFTLSAGTTTTIKINDADATADLWNEYLLVLTNGTYSGDGIIIHDTAAADGGTSTLTFRHTQAGAIDSTTGYLTKDYLIMEYRSTFTELSAYSDEITIDDRYEGDLLLYWFLYNSEDVTSKNFQIYKGLFQEAWDAIVREQCTPTPDNIRPDPTSWPRSDGEYDTTYKYVQDEDWE